MFHFRNMKAVLCCCEFRAQLCRRRWLHLPGGFVLFGMFWGSSDAPKILDAIRCGLLEEETSSVLPKRLLEPPPGGFNTLHCRTREATDKSLFEIYSTQHIWSLFPILPCVLWITILIWSPGNSAMSIKYLLFKSCSDKIFSSSQQILPTCWSINLIILLSMITWNAHNSSTRTNGHTVMLQKQQEIKTYDSG